MADVAVPDRHDTETGATGGAATMRLGRAERGLAFALVVRFLVAIAVMYWLRDDAGRDHVGLRRQAAAAGQDRPPRGPPGGPPAGHDPVRDGVAGRAGQPVFPPRSG